MDDVQRIAGLILLFMVDVAAWAGPAPARAQSTVTNCTEAALANALTTGGHILLSCDSTISLSKTIVVSKDTVLDGTGHTVSLSGGQFTNAGRLFFVQPGVRLTLRGLTVTGGRLAPTNTAGRMDGEAAAGAAIYNDGGAVTLESCVVSDHQVTGGGAAAATAFSGQGGTGGAGLGAAIYNRGGHLIVTNTTFSGNTATGGAGGTGGPGYDGANGGPGGEGGNGGPAAGAAIFNAAGGVAEVMDSLFSTNRVIGSPPGFGGAGSGVLGFVGKPGEPGPAGGGAIFNENGAVTLLNCTFAGNSGTGAAGAGGASGGGLIQAERGTTGGSALGAALMNVGSLSVTNCTFLGNTLTGGNGGAGGAGNPNGFGGDGGNGGRGGAALGAGIYAAGSGETLVVNCTFSENSVQGGAGGPGGAGAGLGERGREGGPGEESGGAIHGAASVRVRNSILAHSKVGGNGGGLISDEGFNLSSDQTPSLSAEGSRNRVDPLFGSLSSDRLAPTLTLSSNSPAINAINAPDGNGCPPLDQRRAARTAPCDIGAYEFDVVVPTPQLTAGAGTDQVILSWVDSNNVVLQSTPALTATSIWTRVVEPGSIAGGVRTLSVGRTNPATFFRLMSQ